jgi:hypothetical protein
MINIVNELTEEGHDSSSRLLGEAKAYLVLWIFFEYFVVFREDLDHMLTIRDYFYRYIFDIDLEHFELFRRTNLDKYRSDISVSSQLSKLKFLIRICDFQEMQNLIENISRLLKEEKSSQNNYPGVYMEFADAFDQLGYICMNYCDIMYTEYGGNSSSRRAEITKNIQTAR